SQITTSKRAQPVCQTRTRFASWSSLSFRDFPIFGPRDAAPPGVGKPPCSTCSKLLEEAYAAARAQHEILWQMKAKEVFPQIPLPGVPDVAVRSAATRREKAMTEYKQHVGSCR